MDYFSFIRLIFYFVIAATTIEMPWWRFITMLVSLWIIEKMWEWECLSIIEAERLQYDKATKRNISS